MNQPTDIPKELRACGLKATLPRLRILQLFREAKEKHLSAEDVYRLLVSENIDLRLGTVYRVLTQFAAAGILLRRHFEGGRAVFELHAGPHHDHLLCTVCGKVEEFVDRVIERRQETIAQKRGFEIQEHSLSIYGTCANCSQARNSGPAQEAQQSRS